MSKVMKCMCEECHHNDSFECKAEAIEVRSSSEGNKVATPLNAAQNNRAGLV